MPFKVYDPSYNVFTPTNHASPVPLLDQADYVLRSTVRETESHLLVLVKVCKEIVDAFDYFSYWGRIASIQIYIF